MKTSETIFYFYRPEENYLKYLTHNPRTSTLDKGIKIKKWKFYFRSMALINL